MGKGRLMGNGKEGKGREKEGRKWDWECEGIWVGTEKDMERIE